MSIITCPGCGKRRRTKPGTPIICRCWTPGSKEFKAREAAEAERGWSKSQEKRIAAQKAPARCRLIQDEDCHWYVIRTTQVEEFNQWQDAMAECEKWDGFDFSEVQVNGPHTVTFPDWKEEL